MYAAVSGLSVHQTKMDVIGNNIANVNTVGFKGSNVTFQEVFSQTIKGAGSPTDGRGGTNPQQIGLGAGVSSISVNHRKGSTQRTDNPTDLMIDGSGFFVVTNDANAQNKFYTRAGNFTVDRNGNLVTAEGYKVLDTDMQPVQINKSETKKATETDTLQLNGNINSSDGDYTTTVDVYDSLGDITTLRMNFIGDAIGVNAPTDDFTGININEFDPKYNDYTDTTDDQGYSFKKMSITDVNGDPFEDATGTPITTFDNMYAMFNEDGQIVDLVEYGASAVGAGDGGDIQTILDGGGTFTPGDVTTFSDTLNLIKAGVDDLDLAINRNIFFQEGDADTGTRTFTQYSQETDAKTVAFDGNSAGCINSFNISSKGEVVGVFTNGERQTLGTITLADFDNPAGLEKVGSNMFINTNNSGTPKYGQPSTGSFGALNPGALEMSNVDLSKEFTEMITTQRGFQANSRVISTSDEILQELVNLKR
jgi:flagellar hook protein FlgE